MLDGLGLGVHDHMTLGGGAMVRTSTVLDGLGLGVHDHMTLGGGATVGSSTASVCTQ